MTLHLTGIGMMVLCAASHTVAQCPVLPVHAFLDANGKGVTVRYHNSGTRWVQAVEFILTRYKGDSDTREVLARYSGRDILRVMQESTAEFQASSGHSESYVAPLSDSLEVQVTRVVFADGSTWRASKNKTCRAPVSLH